MLANWVRRFATKRTIPYAVKNNWKLPEITKLHTPENKVSIPLKEEWGAISQSEEPSINVPKEWRRLKTLPQWKRQMFALKEKFPHGWDPKRKLSRDEMGRLREVKAAQPQLSASELGDMFRTSPEAVRRILKSKWRPNEKEAMKLNAKWIRRGVKLGSPLAKNAANKAANKPQMRKPLRATKKYDPAQEIF